MRPPSYLPTRPALATVLAAALAATLTPSAQLPAQAAFRTALDRRIHTSAVTESSGLARSTYARGILWTHNDSGGRPRVYAVNPDGSTAAVVSLSGARMRDWEDISTGPNNKLWVADIGDNSRRRSVINIYRFTEPRLLRSQTVRATRFDFRYATGRHNAEAMLVHPVSRRIYVVTKSPGGGAIYRAPRRLSTTTANRLTRVASAPVKVTGAAFTPSGRRFVLCNYSTAYVYKSFGGRPVRVDKPYLRQGESIEVNRRGNGMFMGSEGGSSPVYRVPLVSY